MTVEPVGGGGGATARPASSSLADVVDSILDKGLVIDAFARVSLVGIELLTVDARIVVAGMDTYLRFAEAAERLELSSKEPSGLTDLVGDITESGAEGKTKGAIEAAGKKVMDFLDEVDSTQRHSSKGGDR
ncbi:gas vesicle protein GvpJ [Nocardia farcinica]|uniref:gas vesicle protein GvpJ n=1 Tax=Nocardia farcinica TaxID=37329 RepID=UPI0037A9A5E3